MTGIRKVYELLGTDAPGLAAVSHGTTVATNRLLEDRIGDLGFIGQTGFGWGTPAGCSLPPVYDAIRGDLDLELDEHRRKVHCPSRRDAVGDEPMGDVEQWQVALERRFVEPVAAMGPPAVVDHHRKMSV